MRNAGIWLFLSCKRYLKKWSFLLILFLLPAGAFWIHGLESEQSQAVQIGVYVEQDAGLKAESLEQQLAKRLVQEETLFRFYLCDTEEQLKADVASRTAECGYVISGNLREKLDEKDYRRSIRVYSAPSTVLADLSTEVVFASLMELYGREIFVDYVLETAYVSWTENGTEHITEEALENQAGELYDKWLNGGETFRFDFQYRDPVGQAVDMETQGSRVFPVRGIVAVYLFVTGLYSAVMLGVDERKGLFLPLGYGRRQLCRMAVLAAPVLLASISGFTALAVGGVLKAVGRELFFLFLYFLAVCGFSYVMKLICKTPQALCCVISLLLVGSLVFTPVFVDIQQYFPELAWIEKLFLPGWYLRMVS